MKQAEKRRVSVDFVDVVETVLYASAGNLPHDVIDMSMCHCGKTIIAESGDNLMKGKKIRQAVLKPSDMVGQSVKVVDVFGGKILCRKDWRPSAVEISKAYRSCRVFAERLDSEKCSFDELMFSKQHIVSTNGQKIAEVDACFGWSEQKQRLVNLGDLNAKVIVRKHGDAESRWYDTSGMLPGAQAQIWMSIFGQTWWQLIVKVSDSPRLMFHSSPRSVLALLSSRDIQDGKSRREALLHWVRSHNRKASVDDSEATVEIKSYLRGNTTATFGDLVVEIKENQVFADDLYENVLHATA